MERKVCEAVNMYAAKKCHCHIIRTSMFVSSTSHYILLSFVDESIVTCVTLKAPAMPSSSSSEPIQEEDNLMPCTLSRIYCYAHTLIIHALSPAHNQR